MGPGAYVPDWAVGITRVEDLPAPLIQRLSRFRRRRGPQWNRSCSRHGRGDRRLHDIGCLVRDRPRVLHLVDSQRGHLLVRHHLTSSQRTMLRRFSGEERRVRAMRAVGEEPHRLLDRRCRTNTALANVSRLPLRVWRFRRVGRYLDKSNSTSPEKARTADVAPLVGGLGRVRGPRASDIEL